MAIEILMPAMSPSVRVGRLARWLVAPGDVVRPGDVLAEIETATATMEVEAVDGGRIMRILIPSGTDAVAVDTPIALIEPGGAVVHRFPAPTPASREAGARGPGRAAPDAQARGRIKASPLARKRARAGGLPLDNLRGSGPGGRIIARDVAAHDTAAGSASDLVTQASEGWPSDEASVGPAREAGSATAGRHLAHVGALLAGSPIGSSAGSHTVLLDEAALARGAYAPGTYMARAHAPGQHTLLDRLELAHAHVPQQTLHADVRFDELARALQRLNIGVHTSPRQMPSLGVSDVLVKAMGLALRQVREANVSFTRSAMLHHGGADVAIALIGGDPAGNGEAWHAGADFGVVAPVIAHADLKSLSEISHELRSLREMAQSGHLDTAAAIQGGVTTIYDLSGSIVSGLETLVMPPQSSVLVMGAVEAKAVVVDGAVGVHPCARLSLSIDQRAIDARTAMRLLGALKAYVEDPMRMLV